MSTAVDVGRTISFGDRNAGFQIGINNGPITTEWHLPPEQPETSPTPLSTVLFPRDPDFVNHGTLLNQIHEKSWEPASRIALFGLGGVGKSQLAIEYSYQIRDRSPETWVFWVHASNKSRFERGFQDIADRVKIPGRKDPGANICKLIYDWLVDERKGRWILILDNVEDDSFLQEVPSSSQDDNENRTLSQLLSAYLPPNSHGSIIMTTRSKDVASRIVEESDIITVGPMHEMYAVALFEKKLGTRESRKYIVKLSNALEFIPLAIVQAAAYIKQREPRSSVKRYLEEFQRSDRRKLKLLSHEGGQLRRYGDAKNSIIDTWQMSFDQIRQTRPTATDLLSLMSFFDKQGIVGYLLKPQIRSGNSSGGLEENEKCEDGWESYESDDENSRLQSHMNDLFEDDILTLRKYSFISINPSGLSFEMHRLVQLATQKWLEDCGQLEHWKQQFVSNLSREFPTGEHAKWDKCQLLFPHAWSAMTQQPEANNSLEEWAMLLCNAAWFALDKRNIADAKKMATSAMKKTRKALGPEHMSTLRCFNMVGLILCRQGRYEESRILHQWVINTGEKIWGANHPDTLTGIHNLRMTLYSQNKHKKAKIMFQ